MNVNYVSIRDSSQTRRDEWVSSCFDYVETYSFSIENTSSISRARFEYDAFVVGGLDTPRLLKFIKTNIEALRSVPKVAVVDSLHASKRAKLLMAGYDDVWDIERMKVEEASARIRAISNRYAQTNEALLNVKKETVVLSNVAFIELITEKERKILTEFTRSSHRFCSYSSLQSIVSNFGPDITLNNLKVIISNLRKKLKPGVKITSKTNTGYQLDI